MAPVGRPLIVHCTGPEIGDHLPRPTGSHSIGEVHAWFAELADLLPHLERYAALLDDDERIRADRFRFAADRERFVLGHGMLREALGRYLDMEPTAVKMSRGPFGKPYVADSRIKFNMSDTKDAVLIAFTLDQEIGADIETMTRKVDHAAVSDHYFTPEEVMDIAHAVDSKRRFLELWTRKEAVLKASGVGIMEDLRVLRVDAERNVNTITHPEFVGMAAPEYHVNSYRLGPTHVIALALPERPTQVGLNIIHAPLPPKRVGAN